MNAKIALIVLLTLLAGPFWAPWTAYSEDDYYGCYASDGTYFESATPCDGYYNYDYDYPYYGPGLGLEFDFDGDHRHRDRDRDRDLPNHGSTGGRGSEHSGGSRGGGSHGGGDGSHGGGGGGGGHGH